MASQENGPKENTMESLPAVKGEQVRQKAPSKVVRLLTVIAYMLSVSLAAICLSIYYIFIWKDKTFVAAQTLSLTASQYPYNISLLDAVVLENLSLGSVNEESMKWKHEGNSDEMQQQIVNKEVQAMVPPSASPIAEENSTWLDDDFDSFPEEDEFNKSSPLYKRLVYDKLRYI